MTEPKKILFISHDASRTGAPMFLLNLLGWIRANTNLRVSVLLRAGGSLESDFRKLAETHLLPDGTSPLDLLRDVSLIYSNTITNGAFLDSLPRGTIPVLTHVHEMEAVLKTYGEANFESVKNQTSQFIACSNAVARGLIKNGVDQEKIAVVHEAIPVASVLEKSLENSPEQLRETHQWNHDFIVACCGVADWRKGADLFLQIAHRVKQRLSGSKKVLFLWVGILPEDERGKILLNDVRQLDLAGTVEFIGEQPNPHPYIKAADLFCLCSREDPFPLVMLEACALGKPLLCFQKSGGAVELCQKETGFAVPYLDLDKMAEEIVRLAEDDSLRKKTGETAAHVVREQFDVATIAPQIVCFIETLSKRPSVIPFAAAQIYFPTAEGYSENNSQNVYAPSEKWTRLRFDVPLDFKWANGIRFDPCDRPALIEIAGITVKSKASGKILWQAKTAAHFGQLTFSADMTRLPETKLLALSSDSSSDPHFFLPTLPQLASNEPLQVQVWLRLSKHPASAAKIQTVEMTASAPEPVRESPRGIKLLHSLTKFLKN